MYVFDLLCYMTTFWGSTVKVLCVSVCPSDHASTFWIGICTLWAQRLLQFHSDLFETLQVVCLCTENMLLVWAFSSFFSFILFSTCKLQHLICIGESNSSYNFIPIFSETLQVFTEALEGHFYLLLITYYLLLITYYLLLITYYLLLITYYLLLITYHIIYHP